MCKIKVTSESTLMIDISSDANVALSISTNSPLFLHSQLVLCGGPNMILTCCYALRKLGFKSQQIFVFGPFGADLIRRVFGRGATLSQHF